MGCPKGFKSKGHQVELWHLKTRKTSVTSIKKIFKRKGEYKASKYDWMNTGKRQGPHRGRGLVAPNRR
jgi:hypothetical protein